MRLRADLPLGRDASGRFLPLIIALMVYLAALAVAGGMALESMIASWHLDLAGTMTVQVMRAEGGEDERQARLDRVIDLLTKTPGIAGARVLGPEAIAHLLQPWLGSADATRDLPLPDLIAVELMPNATVNIEDLRRDLGAIAPDAMLDDHKRWLDDTAALAGLVRLAVAVVVGLVSLAAVVTVIFVTRTGLAIHRRVIEITHLIGAQDGYIAGQFQLHALRLGLLGGVIGVLLACLTILGLGHLAGHLHTPLLPTLTLAGWQWSVLTALPLGAALIAMLTTRLTVLRSLGRIL